MSAPLSHIFVFFLPILLLIPPFLLLRFILFRSWKRTAMYYFFALYLCALWVFFGLPDCLSGAFSPTFSLIPFAGMIKDPLGALFGFALFLPYGIMLPLSWKRFRDGWKALPAGFFLALFLVLAQLFSPGRTSSVDTLILGAAGTWVGYFISCVLILSNPRMDETAPADGTFPERFGTFAAVLLVMFFLFPLARLPFGGA